MTEENQGASAIVPYNSVPDNVPMKRKRGRPRKDRGQTPGQVFARPTPEAEKKTPVGRIDYVADKKNDMVGQTVFGVIDGSFEAGYLLTVRVGNTDTVLKGIVFQPGSSVPISGSNDVAPHIKMIKRAEVHIPRVGVPTHVHGSSSQSIQMNKRPEQPSQRTAGIPQPVASPTFNQVPILPIQSSPAQVHVTQGVQNDLKAAPHVASSALHHPEGFGNSSNPLTEAHSGPTAQSTPVTPMCPQSEMKDKLACNSTTSTPNHAVIVTQASVPETKAPSTSEAPSERDNPITKEQAVTMNQPDDAALAWQTQMMNRQAAGSVNFFQQNVPSTLTCGAIPVAPYSSGAVPPSGVIDPVSKEHLVLKVSASGGTADAAPAASHK